MLPGRDIHLYDPQEGRGRFTGGLIISMHLPFSHGPLLLVLKSQLSFGSSRSAPPPPPLTVHHHSAGAAASLALTLLCLRPLHSSCNNGRTGWALSASMMWLLPATVRTRPYPALFPGPTQHLALRGTSWMNCLGSEVGNAVARGSEALSPAWPALGDRHHLPAHFPTVRSRNSSLFPYQKTAVPPAPPACASTINTPGLGTGIRGTWEAGALSCVGSGREKHCLISLPSASRHRLALLPMG